MASPQYSIVIVDTTSGGVTTHTATAYKTAQLAKAAYISAINSGNRAFLYEQPIPTHFHRNDSQPQPAS